MRKALIGTACALATIGFVPAEPDFLMHAAHAVVGRPATPLSYAGVARRTTRRTVYTTTAVAVTASTAAARQCYTRYDSYGRAVTTCY